MLKAIDKYDNFVTIDEADETQTYYCPICEQELIQKRGEIREHHFSHIGPRGTNVRNYVPCSDNWNYDKTDWHIQWQKRFPSECYEKVLSKGDEKHIADIFINNIVVEFQHSSISLEEFRKRNKFYFSLGYKVIWVFDLIDECESDRIKREDYPENCYRWTYVKKLFKGIDLEKEGVMILFQVSNEDQEGISVLEKITRSYNEFKTFYTELDNPLSIPEFVKRVKENTIFPIPQKTIQQQPKAFNSKENGKTVNELWEEGFEFMIIENLATNKKMIINGTEGRMWRENYTTGRVVGKYANEDSSGRYYYSPKKYIVWDFEKSVWSLIYARYRHDHAYLAKNNDDKNEKYASCQTLREIINKTNKRTIIVCNLFNEKAYSLEFVNGFSGNKQFNAFAIDLETGEIDDSNKNQEVKSFYDKRFWKEKV